MKVLPIITNNIINQNNKHRKNVYNPTFSHHPDFDRLTKEYQNSICLSGYFRRGYPTFKPSPNFMDIFNVFKKVFDTDAMKKLLIIGVANSQEPFSYLATIKQLRKNKPIESFLDLYTMDLQSKPDKKKLFEDSYTFNECFPDYAKDSFVYDPEHSELSFHKYRVTDDLFNFLYNTYNNPSKSKWETRLQEGITEYPKDSFDIISVNNVLLYLEDEEIYPAIENIYKALKPEGYIITEDDDFISESKIYNKWERNAEGIFKKVK